MGGTTRLNNTIKIVSLLQPPPETFALFDGLVLLSEGKVIYNGPVDKVVQHFESLGYIIPERMDVADWLQVSVKIYCIVASQLLIACLLNFHFFQALPTPDGRKFLHHPEEATDAASHMSTEEFRQRFVSSDLGKAVQAAIQAPLTTLDEKTEVSFRSWVGARFRNNWFASLKLLVAREMLLWWRDKYQIRARIMQGKLKFAPLHREL